MDEPLAVEAVESDEARTRRLWRIFNSQRVLEWALSCAPPAASRAAAVHAAVLSLCSALRTRCLRDDLKHALTAKVANATIMLQEKFGKDFAAK